MRSECVCHIKDVKGYVYITVPNRVLQWFSAMSVCCAKPSIFLYETLLQYSKLISVDTNTFFQSIT